MKVAFVSLQQRDKGFDNSLPVSYVALNIQEWKKPSEQFDHMIPVKNSLVYFYTHGNLIDNKGFGEDGLFSKLNDVNAIIVFNKEYTIGMLQKYYFDGVNIEDDFYVFDIQSLCEDFPNVYEYARKWIRLSKTCFKWYGLLRILEKEKN